MSDYIKRKDALDNIIINYEISANDCCRMLCDCLYKMTKHMIPAADVVERKRGKWIECGEPNERGEYELWYCNCDQCGAVGLQEYNFCYNCGADMRGES